MQTVSKQTTGTVYYFPEHDNMMHFQLLHGFRNDNYYYSLEKYPFKIFEPYYQKPDSNNFKSGWLIVNKGYTVLSATFFKITDSLKENNYFSKTLSKGRIDAYYIDSAEKLKYVKAAVANNETIIK